MLSSQVVELSPVHAPLRADATSPLSDRSGTHLLGPIKSRISREMGASNSQFSLLLAALSYVPSSPPICELPVIQAHATALL